MRQNKKYTFAGRLPQLKKFGYEKWQNKKYVYEKCVDNYEIDIFKDKTILISNDIDDICDQPMSPEFEWLIEDLIKANLVLVEVEI